MYTSINFNPIPRSGQTPQWLLVSDICKSLKHAWYWGCLIWSGEGNLQRIYPIDNINITSMVGLTRLLPGHRYIFDENWPNQEVKSSLLPSCGNHSPTILGAWICWVNPHSNPMKPPWNPKVGHLNFPLFSLPGPHLAVFMDPKTCRARCHSCPLLQALIRALQPMTSAATPSACMRSKRPSAWTKSRDEKIRSWGWSNKTRPEVISLVISDW